MDELSELKSERSRSSDVSSLKLIVMLNRHERAQSRKAAPISADGRLSVRVSSTSLCMFEVAPFPAPLRGDSAPRAQRESHTSEAAPCVRRRLKAAEAELVGRRLVKNS